MNGLGNQFLSRPALSCDQHRAVGCADHFDHLEQFLHGRTLANQAAESMNLLELASQVSVLFAQPTVLESVANDDFQFLEIVLCLEDVIERAHLQGLDRGVCTRKGRQEDELAIEAVRADMPQKLSLIHISEPTRLL